MRSQKIKRIADAEDTDTEVITQGMVITCVIWATASL
jgi:hypothetical protein